MGKQLEIKQSVADRLDNTVTEGSYSDKITKLLDNYRPAKELTEESLLGKVRVIIKEDLRNKESGAQGPKLINKYCRVYCKFGPGTVIYDNPYDSCSFIVLMDQESSELPVELDIGDAKVDHVPHRLAWVYRSDMEILR